jgi:hypothetical protein
MIWTSPTDESNARILRADPGKLPQILVQEALDFALLS